MREAMTLPHSRGERHTATPRVALPVRRSMPVVRLAEADGLQLAKWWCLCQAGSIMKTDVEQRAAQAFTSAIRCRSRHCVKDRSAWVIALAIT